MVASMPVPACSIRPTLNHVSLPLDSFNTRPPNHCSDLFREAVCFFQPDYVDSSISYPGTHTPTLQTAMASYQLPAISTVPSLSTSDLTTVLDHLFEPCVPLHTLSVNLLRDKKFSSYDDVIASVGVQLQDLAESSSTSDTRWLESILAAHPRLGEKKVESAQSQQEQAQLASGQAGGVDKLGELNALYESTFPGLRYVVFVNGRDRSTIMDDMEARIGGGDITIERAEAIKVGFCTCLESSSYML